MPKYPKPDAEQEEWMNAPGGTPKGCEACGACDHLQRCDHCGKCRNCGRYIANTYPVTVYPQPAIQFYPTYPMYYPRHQTVPTPWAPTTIGTITSGGT